ncbi:alpha-1A adrenergic receptor-like [Montipora foliosa]|uniref:alpha-1A adrenergic receptor-like n=1 Tax=Montipora foliosa TaxID=591990 RepID=UPI0035F1EAA5
MRENSNECRAFYNKCETYDLANNITEPDFDRGCWKDFLDLCLPAAAMSCPRSSLALVIPLMIVAVLSVATNSLVCIVFAMYRQLRLIRHYFVINLAVADILIAAILIPLFVAAQLTDDNILLSHCQLVLDIACGTASILCLAAISLERYVAVKYSLRYHSIVTQRKAVFCMVFIWAYSFVVSCASLLSLVNKAKEGEDKLCLFAGSEYLTFVTLASFVLPLGVMVFAYWNIFQVARIHARRINSLQSTSSDPSGSTHSKRGITRELKGVKTLTIIMGTHFVCWCPLFVFFLVYTYCPSCRGHTMNVVNYIILLLRHCNSFANPLIYSGVNKQFRAGIKRFLFRREDSIGEMQITAGSRLT